MRAAALLPLALLTGCIHGRPPSIAFDCVDDVKTATRSMTAERIIEANGKQRHAQIIWSDTRHDAGGVRVGGGWYANSGEPDLMGNHLSLRFADQPTDFGGVELRVGDPTVAATDPQFVNRKRHNAAVFPQWPAMLRALASGQPLTLVMLDKSHRVIRSLPIDRAIFDGLLESAQASIERSRKMAEHPAERCVPYEEVIVG